MFNRQHKVLAVVFRKNMYQKFFHFIADTILKGKNRLTIIGVKDFYLIGFCPET